MRGTSFGAVMAGVLLLGWTPSAGAQVRWTTSADDDCERWGDRTERHCEVREATLAAVGRLQVEGGANGGIKVEGWERNEVRVRARVWTSARSQERAAELSSLVELVADDGRLRAQGPGRGDRGNDRESWGVTWEVMVPAATDLRLETNNGGIGVDGVSGVIEFEAQNGGVRLEGVGGDVRGRTMNGGLQVRLSGSTWSGRGLDAHTTNGGVTITVPDDYSAELEMGTVNGRMETDFPVTVQGRIGRSLRTVLGSGGPLIRAMTTNGSVRLVRR